MALLKVEGMGHNFGGLRAVDQFNLSARAYQRVLRVARTIADLADEAELLATHVAEALSLRQLDRRRP